MKADDIHNRYREEEKEAVKNDESQEVINEETINLDDDMEILEDVETLEVEEEDLSLEEVIIQLQDELEELEDKYLRTVAEHENFKKRMQEEKIKDRMYANQSLLEELIGVVDIFDQAVNMKTDDEKLENFLIGFKMINENIKQVLANQEVYAIKSIGQKFDPRYHSAVEVDWDETQEEGIILEELQRGYTFKDRILRASQVKVNKKNGGNNNE